LPPSVVKSAIHEQTHSLSKLPKRSSKVPRQTVAPVEQEDNRGNWPEEEKEEHSINWTGLNICRTDPHYLLRSQNPAECPAVNTLSGLTCGVPQKGLSQNKHKIRVDFKVWGFFMYEFGIYLSKIFSFTCYASTETSHPFFPCACQEDCAVQNVWLMGGLSVLTSVSTTPQPVCLLCASKGRHEMIFCQICCEPFHSFCLLPEERPLKDNKENWCCRRCKFCHVCGRRSKNTKPVLQCRRCQTSYHPACLGPTYPKPMNCKIPWVCMTCIRCKSCGVTPGKTWDLAWNHDEDLCPDCTLLHKKGNFCTICHKCYDDNMRHAEMIQCSACNHWIHYSCEGISVICSLRQSYRPLKNTAMHSGWRGATRPESPEAHRWSTLTVPSCFSQSSHNLMQCHVDAGRLLYMGQNEWAHVNCSLWSAEVYEENGALLQVHSAVSRGRHLRCDHCGQSGATVGCCLATCQSNFHFMCARVQNCVFQQDRKVYCYKHRDLVSDKKVTGKGFEVCRRVYVDFEGINLRRKFLTGLEPESINMTIGSLQIQKLGVLTELSSNGRMLYPVGYQCSRLYWSTVDPRRLCRYTCKVTEVSTPLPGEEQDPQWDQEENHTTVHSPSHHRDMESPDCFSSSSSPVKSTTSSPYSKHHLTPPGSKSPGYTQARKPAVGSSRPLPSPGTIPPKSHHILTLRDLEDTRRPRRLSSRSRCSLSPTDSDPSAPANLRSGGPGHPRTSLFSSPPRSSTSPLLSLQNSASPVWSSPPQSGISAGLSPQQGLITHIYRGRQNFKITTPVSAEVPQDFLASSEAEDAAVATTNGISLAPENLEEEVANLMAQELPYTVFDTDTEVAVASMLNAKMEFDDALLAENVALSCGAQGKRGEAEDVTQNVEKCKGGSDSEDSSHYLKFSRTVVCDTGSCSANPGQVPSPNSISQLDGADGGSDSEGMEDVDDDSQNPDTPARPLTVAPLESDCSTAPPSADYCPPDVFHVAYGENDMQLQEEEVQMSCEIPTPQNEGVSDPGTGQFSEILDYPNKNPVEDKEESSSSTDSFDAFKDDLNDPDYSPEHTTKTSPKAPAKNVIVNRKSAPSFKQLKVCLPQQNSLKLKPPPQSAQILSGASTSPLAANFASVPRTVSSPIVLNGLNALPIQPGATRGKAVAIRLHNSHSGPKQQVVIPNQAAATGPSPQVLLVNRQGQILIKDPRTNTYQSLSASSPAYNKISHIAKILHSSNAFQRPVPRFIIRPSTQANSANVPAVGDGATSKQRVIVRVVPVKGPDTSAITARVSPPGAPEASPSEVEKQTTQAAADQAPTTHQDAQKTEPIILRRSKARCRRAPKFLQRDEPDQPAAAPARADGLQPSPASARRQVKVKRVSSVADRPPRKKSKLDCMKDQDELDEPADPRPAGVRMRAPTTKEVLDTEQENTPDRPEQLRITAPPLYTPRRHPPAENSPTSSSNAEGKTHVWVSARHGDLSEFSSEEDAFGPKHRKRTYMNQPHLRFEITSDDGFSVKASSIEVAWRAVIDGVLEARADFHLKQMPLGGVSGPRMLGVVHDAVIFLLEQLQGAANCKHQPFRFHRCEDTEEELPINPKRCARSEIYSRKATFDMFNFLASQHRELPDLTGPFEEEDDEFPLKSSRRATSSELPMAMRFRHLEKISKEAVGVYRSDIHGRGLFCKRNIEAGEMVIEYAGTVIRAVLTDKRQKFYDSKGIGCYMFRIDDFDVVDATMQGNAARFINHSCEPNCYSRVINIYRGEELTYDYKFPIEDDESKLHCNCGTRRCRGFLN
ncbi:unnamed protein product, partial [Tetraodon nigroviridis]